MGDITNDAIDGNSNRLPIKKYNKGYYLDLDGSCPLNTPKEELDFIKKKLLGQDNANNM